MQKIHSWAGALSPTVLWIGILTTVGMVHASYIPNGFNWLDHGDIELGRVVLPLSHLFEAFLTPFGQTGFYRPLLTIIHSLDAAIYNKWAPGYHLTNVILHVLATGAFALFLNQFLSLKLPERLIATLAAGVHPLSWLPTGAISYRPELLATLFVFLTLFFHTKARTSNQKRNIILAAVCAGLGFLSKESTLVWIPGLILLWEVCTPQKRYGQTVFIWELLALTIYAGSRWFAVPDLWQASATTLPISQALGTRLTSIGTLLWDLALPILPALSDATPIHTITDFPAWFTGVFCLIIGITIISLGKNSPWLRVLLFAAIAIAPALNLVPLPRFRSPHYAYLASFAIGMTAGLILQIAREQTSIIRTAIQLSIVIWIVMAMGTTAAAGFRFSNDHTLFASEVAKDPEFREGHYYLGLYLKKQGNLNRAAESYSAALHENPNTIAYVDARSAAINLAEIRLTQNRPDEAENLLAAAANGAPEYRALLITYNRALIAAQQGNHDRVVTLLANPTHQWKRPEPLLLLARALGHLGRTKEAATALRKSLPLLNDAQKQKVHILMRQIEQ